MTIDPHLIKKQIRNLEEPDFRSFVYKLFKTEYKDHFSIYDKIGQDTFIRKLRDDYGYEAFKGIYLIDHLPINLFKNPEDVIVDNPFLMKKLEIIYEDFKDKIFLRGPMSIVTNQLNSLYLITNLNGFDTNFYLDNIIPKYEKIIKKAGLYFDKHFGVYTGNPDTFLELKPKETLNIITELLNKKNAISLELSNDSKEIRLINTESPFLNGFGKTNKDVFSPVYFDFRSKADEKIREFEELIRSNPNENKLEKFIQHNYVEIFGNKYDRIETQIWLRFPQLDINRKERRLDVFMRNAIKKDWELFELKKIIPLTKTYRDVPTLTSEIYSSIQQIKNYDRLLKNPEVKDYFNKEGIEYYEPTLHLVVGNEPSICLEQWRWLVTTNKDVNILTYSELYEEMLTRLNDKEDFLNKIKNNI